MSRGATLTGMVVIEPSDTTALLAAKCQSFLDNLLASCWPRKSWNDRRFDRVPSCRDDRQGRRRGLGVSYLGTVHQNIPSLARPKVLDQSEVIVPHSRCRRRPRSLPRVIKLLATTLKKEPQPISAKLTNAVRCRNCSHLRGLCPRALGILTCPALSYIKREDVCSCSRFAESRGAFPGAPGLQFFLAELRHLQWVLSRKDKIDG
jgi:hypothetical protein